MFILFFFFYVRTQFTLIYIIFVLTTLQICMNAVQCLITIIIFKFELRLSYIQAFSASAFLINTKHQHCARVQYRYWLFRPLRLRPIKLLRPSDFFVTSGHRYISVGDFSHENLYNKQRRRYV